jgi:dTDP-4-dehydrorhamnose 3,5-epimerase-like enzyme
MDYKIEKFEKHNDERGQLVVFLKNKNLEKQIKTFGQIYFVTFEKKGIVRGNHYHKNLREWFGVVQGKVKVVLIDVKSRKKKEMVLDGNSKNFIRLEIGPNVIHAFKSMSDFVSLINYSDKEWAEKDVIHVDAIK